MNERIVVLSLAILIIFGVLFFMIIAPSNPRSLGGELIPTPTSTYYEPMQQAKQDMVIYFDVACGDGEGIYYYRISDNTDAVIGFLMSDVDYLEQCQ